jgi:tetratricopeptide (TPR) repeat protein
MAKVYGNLGLYRDALPIAETAVDLRRQNSPNSVLLADSLDQLGAIRTNLGDPASAAELHRESRAIREALGLRATSGYALNLQHEAITAYMQSDFELARDVMMRALNQAESLDEANPVLVADITGNLGVIYDQLGDLDNAEQYKRRAVESFDRLYGPLHPAAATARNNLALTLNRLQQPAAAAVIYREALAAYRQLYPEEHPNTANSMNNLAQVLVSLGQMEEAESLQREGLEMFEAIFGPEHSQVGTAAVNLGRILTANGRITEAEKLLRHALAMQTKLHPENHLRIFLAREALAANLNAGSNFDEALQLATSAREHFEQRYGKQHWRTARASSIVADSLIGKKDIRGAELILTEALPIVVSGLGEAHPASVAVMRSLVALYEATGQDQFANSYKGRIQAARP